MNIKEFETLTGKKVTAEEYADIEKVYMAADDIDKETFCAAWKAQKFGYIIDELVKQVHKMAQWREQLKEQLEEADENNMNTARMLLEKAQLYKDGELKKTAIELIGIQQVVRIDVGRGYNLNAAERDFILKNFYNND